MPNYQIPQPVGRDEWHARPVTTNAGIDGTGSDAKFKPTPGLDWSGGFQVNSITVASESGTPTETYNFFVQYPGTGGIVRRFSVAVTAGVTAVAPDDFFIPPGGECYVATVAGVDANVFLTGDRYTA